MIGRQVRWWRLLLAASLLTGGSLQAAEKRPEVLNPAQLKQMLDRKEDFALVDVMSRLECMDHRIPGSLCVADEEFASQAPRLFPDKNRLIVLYCESDRCYRSRETASQAIAQGYRRVAVLTGGMPAWKEAGYEMESLVRIPRVPVESVKPDRLAQWMKEKRDLLILDVRREDRFREGHLPGAINIPLYRLEERYRELPLNRPILVVDDRGLRSFLASSYLIRKGIADVKRLFGGMERWQAYSAKGKGKQ
ncbi:MAG: rhodanese-like domain-containing protein [Deltaproteobacteria bacterium]|nr:rhodanese-like domain-containing protein [Deltaproteobacteria bacterium]